MKNGMFKVTFGGNTSGDNFTAETVIAVDALDAIRKATKKVGKSLAKAEGGLYATSVEVLGWES